VNPTGTPIGPSFPAGNLVPTTIPQTRGVVVATGTTQIDRSDVIVNPNDGSYAKTDFAQIIQRLNINDDIQILHTTFFAYLSRRQFGSLRYSAIVEPSYALENRLELHVNSELPIMKQSPGIKASALDKEDKSPQSTSLARRPAGRLPIC